MAPDAPPLLSAPSPEDQEAKAQARAVWEAAEKRIAEINKMEYPLSLHHSVLRPPLRWTE